MGNDPYGKIDNPKNLSEWFHNHDLENRGPFYNYLNDILKELYSDKYKDLIPDGARLLAKIPKNKKKKGL